MNISEFSKRAGLSTATVSRAFHEPGKVRAKTREHVLALADKLAYYPNPSGRALVRGRYDTIGLVWPLEAEGADALFVQRILAALAEQLTRNNLDLLVCPVDRRQRGSLDHAKQTFPRSRCDAWILLYPRHNDVLIPALRTSRKPVICLMGKLAECPGWKWVVMDQHSWMEDALRRLWRNGARRVLFLGCRRGEPDHEERLAAFNKLAPRFFKRGFLSHPVWPLDVTEVGSLLLAERVDAVIGDDAAVLTALRAAKQLGIAVPGDIQIIGIDPIHEKGPATYRQPLSEMTACAVELALGRRLRSQKFEAVFVPGDSIREG